MLKRCALVAVFSLVAMAGESPSRAETPDPRAAVEALKSLHSCYTSDLPPLFALIKKYRSSGDIDIKVVVAEAESQVAFVYSYENLRMEARSTLSRIIKEYENQPDERLQTVVAQARIQLSGMERNASEKRNDVEPIIVRYKDTKNLDLLYSYAEALDVVAATERGTEMDDEGRQLSEEAHEVFYAVEKQRPPPTDKSSDNDICL